MDNASYALTPPFVLNYELFNKSNMNVCVENVPRKEANEKDTLAKEFQCKHLGFFWGFFGIFLKMQKKPATKTYHVLNIVTSLYFLVKTLLI